MGFTKAQLENWKAYENVRKAGRWNMLAPQARQATGLTSEQYAFVMDNYTELKEATLLAEQEKDHA